MKITKTATRAGEKLDLTLWGMHPMDYDEKGNLKPASVQKGYTVSAVDANGNAVVSAITDENGKVSLTILPAAPTRSPL